MTPRKSSYSGPTRFVGANIPLDLSQVFDEARVEKGISTTQEGVTAAIALWVEHNPPQSGLTRAISNLIREVSRSRATREAIDIAVNEWRNSGSTDVLKKIAELSAMSPDIKLPNDVESAIRNTLPAPNSRKASQ